METNNTSVPSDKPVPMRRVGCCTLGLCLIATGLFLLVYYFVPDVDFILLLKLAPAMALVLLGSEVLFFATRQERWKYDFVSVFVCLLLIGGCIGLAALPALLTEWSPETLLRAENFAAEYRDSVYPAFSREAPDIALRDINCQVQLSYSGAETLEELAQEEPAHHWLRLTAELYGPYPNADAFAADCARLTRILRQQPMMPTVLVFRCDGVEYVSMHSGTVPQTSAYTLTMSSPVQMDWDVQQMACETEVLPLLEEENAAAEPTATPAQEDL